MIREYYNLAEEYRQKTAAIIQKIGPTLEPPYRLSLQIIFNLYLLVFEKIDVENGRFTARELTPHAGRDPTTGLRNNPELQKLMLNPSENGSNFSENCYPSTES